MVLLRTASYGVVRVLAVTVGISWKDFMSFSRYMDKVVAALGLTLSTQIDLFKSTKKSEKLAKPSLPMGAYYSNEAGPMTKL